MKWEIVDKYLTEVAKACYIERDSVRIVVQDMWPHAAVEAELTPENVVKWDSQKPGDSGGTRYKVWWRGTAITDWCLVPFPGCCAFCISTQVWVSPTFRKRGINTLSNKFRQEIASDAGYTGLICTDVITNEAERKTLKKTGWIDIYGTTNRRTNNEVAISLVELYPPR